MPPLYGLLFVLVEWETFQQLCSSGRDCWAVFKIWHA